MTEKKDDHQPKRLSPRARLLLTTGAILVLLPCLGLVCSIASLKAQRAGVLSRWRSLGSPPGNGVEIVIGDRRVVYVRTATSSIYGCEHGGRRVADNCWYEAQEPLSVDREARIGERLYKGEVEPPTGTVADTLDVTVWYGDGAFETRYILLEDGTVWKWEYGLTAYGDLGIIVLGPVAGVALGIVVVIVLWARVGLRSLQRRIKRKGNPDEGVQVGPR